LKWINKHQRTASPITIKKAFLILAEIGKIRKGIEILNSYGFIEFGIAYIDNLKEKNLSKEG